MAPKLSGRLLVICAVLIVAASGCGKGTASGDLDKVGIEISRFDITVTNTSGRALLDVRVEILPIGRATSYSVFAGRLENSEKRSFALDRFTDRDAVPFSPRRAKASAVAVAANDIDGVAVHVEVPWKQ
jgi:hypothetical protein